MISVDTNRHNPVPSAASATAAMEQFQRELAELQAEMDRQPRPVWRLDPSDLAVNINT